MSVEFADSLTGHAVDVLRRACAAPVELPDGSWAACKSRSFFQCPRCALVYRRDWSEIIRDGVEGLSSPHRLVLLTLTAPSFGRVHRTNGQRCGCGVVHGVEARMLRGVPVNPLEYDYVGLLGFNRDIGVLWRYTLTYLRRVLPSFDYVVVKEWQARGALHLHVLLRLPPGVVMSELSAAVSGVVGSVSVPSLEKRLLGGDRVWCWGSQFRVDDLGLVGGSVSVSGGEVSRTVRYVGKVLGYLGKDLVSQVEVAASSGVAEMWVALARQHARLLSQFARDLAYEVSEPGSAGSAVFMGHPGLLVRPADGACRDYSAMAEGDFQQAFPGVVARQHNLGASSHVVTQSRPSKRHAGWSRQGLTRKVLHQRRVEFMEKLRASSGDDGFTWSDPSRLFQQALTLHRQRFRGPAPPVVT